MANVTPAPQMRHPERVSVLNSNQEEQLLRELNNPDTFHRKMMAHSILRQLRFFLLDGRVAVKRREVANISIAPISFYYQILKKQKEWNQTCSHTSGKAGGLRNPSSHLSVHHSIMKVPAMSALIDCSYSGSYAIYCMNVSCSAHSSITYFTYLYSVRKVLFISHRKIHCCGLLALKIQICA